MAFKVFNKKENNEDVYFKLVEEATGGISLVGCDKKGERLTLGHILKITPNGILLKSHGISESIGLKLDEEGRIKEETYS